MGTGPGVVGCEAARRGSGLYLEMSNLWIVFFSASSVPIYEVTSPSQGHVRSRLKLYGRGREESFVGIG